MYITIRWATQMNRPWVVENFILFKNRFHISTANRVLTACILNALNNHWLNFLTLGNWRQEKSGSKLFETPLICARTGSFRWSALFFRSLTFEKKVARCIDGYSLPNLMVEGILRGTYIVLIQACCGSIERTELTPFLLWFLINLLWYRCGIN